MAVLASLATTVSGSATALAAPSQPTRSTRQPTNPEVLATVTSVTPDTVDANGTITIRGTVRNTSTVPMTWVQVSFWRSRDPITDVGSLDSVLVSPITMPVGERWFNEKNEASLDNITDPEATQTFEPGQTAPFQVSGTAKEMGLTTPGSYLVGVHVQATPKGRDRMTVGRARVLTVVSDTATKAQLTPVIELSSRPSVGLDGTFMDDHLAGELTGRLNALVDAAVSRRSTVVIDPALLDEVTSMAAGYTIDGKPGTGTQAAKDWLGKVRPLLSSGRVFRLPYGNADVVGAARAGRSVVLSRTQTALTSDNPASSLPLAIVDEAGALDRRSFSAISSALHPEVVLSAASSPSESSSVVSGTTLIPLTAGLLDGGPDHATSTAQSRGRLLAQTLLNSQAGRHVVTVVTSDSDLAATEPTSWLTLSPLSTAVGTPSITSPLPASSTVPTSLRGSWWTDQGDAARDAADWGDILGDAELARTKTARTLSRATSVNLGSAGHSQWLNQAMASADQLLAGHSITLHSAESFVMSSSSNALPLTVTNRLAETIRLKVVFTSENPQRITIPATPVVTVRSGETQTIRFAPRASSNGVVEMSAQLTSPSGRPLGSPHQFVVRATRMDDIGWIIIIISGAVVLGATLLRIHQVRSRDGTGAASLAEELSEGLEEATEHPDEGAAPDTPATAPATAPAAPKTSTTPVTPGTPPEGQAETRHASRPGTSSDSRTEPRSQSE
ncbi:hypothetical protein C0Z10_13300 [Acidipropionibacterium jensenii]|uniref:Glycoprotein n=1 Tax=Acidipropionibacterium jensenii TaxID=1749 RepID=A0A3T0S2L3_9ACTN|nr:DUF6049 family protein [Acidipropionibacterium jensenii]AZZ40551.1 hypothetical protein C0Z10_13300 [Acidipropionibacterium jensenii]